MTYEEGKAIERLNRFKAIKVLYTKTFAMTTEQLKVIQEDIETILSMLKENSAEIEQKNTELAEKNAEIERLNRKINLMAEFLGERDLGYYKNETGGEILGIMRKYNKEDWKKYFERKATNNG